MGSIQASYLEWDVPCLHCTSESYFVQNIHDIVPPQPLPGPG